MTRPRTDTALSAPLAALLASGGDARSVVDTQTGLNPYGCALLPRPRTLGFASSTASSLSPQALCRVRRERDLLRQSAPVASCLEDRMEGLRCELKALLGIAPATEVVFSPSGTDSVLHALFLTRALNGHKPLDCLLAASDETGTGVPLALAGRHFSAITSEGVPVTEGGGIVGLSDDVRLVPLPLRDAARADRDVVDAVARSVASGRRVLLQAMDSSKWGARRPSLDCLRHIQGRFGDAVTVVVDACQMRLSPARLRLHLAAGHMALVSGSKFFGGPPFSGALLVPAALSERLACLPFAPSGLADYTGRNAWPCPWERLRAALPDRTNYGQFFRWSAALEEMRGYFAVPPGFRRAALCRFSTTTAELLRERAPRFLLVGEGPAPLEDWEEDSEMGVRTIFPFAMRRGERWLTLEEADVLCRALNRDLTAELPDTLTHREAALAAQPCHLGRPVPVTMADGAAAGALRLCAGARTVTRLWSLGRRTSDVTALRQQRREIVAALDKAALIVRHLPLG